MLRVHFPACQPALRDGQSGFLKLGQTPEHNTEEFEMALKIMGIPTSEVKPISISGGKKGRSGPEIDGGAIHSRMYEMAKPLHAATDIAFFHLPDCR